MRTFKAVLARQFPVMAGCMRLWYYDQVLISLCHKEQAKGKKCP